MADEMEPADGVVRVPGMNRTSSPARAPASPGAAPLELVPVTRPTIEPAPDPDPGPVIHLVGEPAGEPEIPADPSHGPLPPAAVGPAGGPAGGPELHTYAEGVSADFDTFYRAQRSRISKALALSLGDVDLAVEATDEAFTRAYERWTRVSALAQPEGWVYRVATNWALSIFRRRRLGLHRFHDPSVPAAPGAEPAVHAAVAALDVKQRSVVVCRHLLGWSVAETANALGISEGTVKSRLSRANATLRVQLKDLDPADSPKEPS
jgi:RNA polymerase sigma-70 factor (ECF subfamily)